MKKSNKLLVGGFLTGLLLITTIHVTLYAKYKAGNFTVYHSDKDFTVTSMQSFPNILFVSVRNVPGATVNFSDMAAVEKGEDNALLYVRRGDTLLISSRDSTNSGMDYPVTFNLPYNATVSVFNSALSFRNSKKAAESNPVIHLQKSNVVFSGTGAPLQFGTMKLMASDSSTVAFEGNTQVANLQVQLFNSSFEYSDGDPGQLSIVTDSVSRISLQSKHLVKANIKTIGSQ